MLAHWRDDESAAGRTMALARLCVGDASSKCKEAGGAQDRIIHNDGGSCRGICADGDAGLGRKSLESRTSATTKAHMVAAVCIIVVVTRSFSNCFISFSVSA